MPPFTEHSRVIPFFPTALTLNLDTIYRVGMDFEIPTRKEKAWRHVGVLVEFCREQEHRLRNTPLSEPPVFEVIDLATSEGLQTVYTLLLNERDRSMASGFRNVNKLLRISGGVKHPLDETTEACVRHASLLNRAARFVKREATLSGHDLLGRSGGSANGPRSVPRRR